MLSLRVRNQETHFHHFYDASKIQSDQEDCSRDSTTQDPIDPVNEPQVEVGDQPNAKDPRDAHQKEMAQFMGRQEAIVAEISLQRASIERL